MWKLLTVCIACKTRINPEWDSSSFPLCKICKGSLIYSPPLCHKCGGHLCTQKDSQECLKPWRSEAHSKIDSYSSRYLLLDSGYRILKKWKVYGGPLFDRQILQSDDSLLSIWKQEHADGVVPIPQNFFRAWQMKGSRTETIAKWVAKQVQIPVIHGLQIQFSLLSRRKKQAELGLKERLATPTRFLAHFEPSLENKNIILVDDFMTTGRTLNQAAAVLKSAGAKRIHVFCLGVRILRLNWDA